MDYKNIIFYSILAYIITIISGPIIIPLLRKLNIGQNVREDGPETHLSKSGTPTMGGLIMVMALILTLIVSRQINKNIVILLLSTLGFGLVGFIDDYFKLAKKRSLGLKPYQKLIGQFLLAAILTVYHMKSSAYGSKLIVPFSSKMLDLGKIYIPFMLLVIVGTVNSVNLTDGLDGLAGSITFIVMVFFAIVSFSYKMLDISLFSAILAATCLGYLLYNAYPAKVFMGDTGSMALGGAVAGVAVLLNLSLVIPIVGCIYFIEAISVIIQVLSYKIRKKRVFLMAPIHHHFEEKGWAETRIVVMFISITIVLSLIAYMGLF